MSRKAPLILDVVDFEMENLLRFNDYGVKKIPDRAIVKAGKLSILHGHEFGRSVFSPVNPARGYYTRAKESVICGHNHQTSEHTEKSISGDIVTTWSTGCLSELSPDYMPYNKWNHGFAHIEVQKGGGYRVFNKKIIQGEVR